MGYIIQTVDSEDGIFEKYGLPRLGVILREDVWQPHGDPEGILVEVLWCDGHVGWILRSRVSDNLVAAIPSAVQYQKIREWDE